MNLKGSTGPLSRLLSNVIIQNHPRVRVLGAKLTDRCFPISLLRGRRYNRAKKAPHRPEKGDQNDPLNPQKTAHRPARARIGGKTTEGGLYDGRNEGRNYGKNELWGYFWGYL